MRVRYPEFIDTELVLLATIGNLEAYDELVRRYRGAVLAVIRRATPCRELAEDVAQDVLLLGYKALPQLQAPERFGPWLCAIARRAAWRAVQRAERESPAAPVELDALLLAHSEELCRRSEDVLVSEERAGRVRAALDGLPAEHGLPMELYYCEQWSVEQIGQFLSLPRTTVKWRLHQGRKLLGRALREEMEEIE